MTNAAQANTQSESSTNQEVIMAQSHLAFTPLPVHG
jgi:hypothetical protein